VLLGAEGPRWRRTTNRLFPEADERLLRAIAANATATATQNELHEAFTSLLAPFGLTTARHVVARVLFFAARYTKTGRRKAPGPETLR